MALSIFNQQRKIGSSGPTLMQWVARFNEYSDEPQEMINKFSHLLKTGYEPNYAFELATDTESTWRS